MKSVKRKMTLRFVLAGCIGLLAACTSFDYQPVPLKLDMTPAVVRTIDGISILDQGWSDAEMERFNFTTQGSRIFRYEIFVALELGTSERLYTETPNVRRLGYVPAKPSALNPDGLPVGFVRDDADDKAWLGLTCAACHTGELRYSDADKGGEYKIRIQGGQSHGNLMALVESLLRASEATLASNVKAERTLARINKRGREAWDMPALRTSLGAAKLHLGRIHKWYTDGEGEFVRHGFGRTDAFSFFFNEALLRVGAKKAISTPAPVDFPVLWDIAQHDYVQWVGNVGNSTLGPLGRNVGEVMGVHGDFALEGDDAGKSSVRFENLIALEEQLLTLWSPRWPASILGAIDEGRARRGKALYAMHCQSCHHALDRTSPERRVRAHLHHTDTLGTDVSTAESLAARNVPTGAYEGEDEPVSSTNLPGVLYEFLTADEFGADTSGAKLAKAATRDVLLYPARNGFDGFWMLTGQVFSSFNSVGERVVHDVPEERQRRPRQHEPLYAYKARPLNGIWSSAPYLHNGSVPTLHQLLLPPAQRVKAFSMVRPEFDATEVGIKHGEASGQPLRDTSTRGNCAWGHPWGPGMPTLPAMCDKELPEARNLTEQQKTRYENERRDLLEFLKTL